MPDEEIGLGDLEHASDGNSDELDTKPPTEHVKPEHPKTAWFRRLDTDAQIRTQQLALLVGNAVQPDQVSQESITFDDFLGQVRSLHEDPMDSAKYIAASGRILHTANALGFQTQDEIERLQTNVESRQARINQLEESINEIDNTGGIARVRSMGEKRRLNQEKKRIAEEVLALEEELEARKRENERISLLYGGLGRKHDILIVEQVLLSAQTVKEGYEAFAEKIGGEGDLLWEVQDQYIQTMIMPRIDAHVWDGLTQDRDIFYSDLKAYLTYEGDSVEGKQSLKTALDESAAKFGLGDFTDYYKVLLDGGAKETVTDFIARAAGMHIARFLEITEESLVADENKNYRGKIMTTLGVGSGVIRKEDPNFGERIWKQVIKRGGYPNMDIWDAIKASGSMQEIFGDTLTALDNQYYTTALKNSFMAEATEDIKALEHYPTPEAIRNLVILAAADYKHPSSSWVRNTLVSMSQRPDWGELLDSTIATYPSLGSARDMLEKFGSSNINIQHEVKDFMLAMLHDTEGNGQLKGSITREVLYKGLPTTELVRMLREQSILTEKEAEDIKFVEEIIASIRGEGRDVALPFSFNQDLSMLKVRVRGSVQGFFSDARDVGEEDHERVMHLKQLARLSHHIGVNKENPSVLGFLISDNVLEIIRKKQVNVDVLVNVAKTPLIDKKLEATRDFIVENADVLLPDNEGLAFINRLIGEYGQKADPLIRGYYECMKEGALAVSDRQLVLEFAKHFRVIAPAILSGYKEARGGGYESVYLAQLTALAEKMTGFGEITDEEKGRAYYKELLRHVYPHNSGNWTTYESNESCSDRSQDIAGFNVQPRYEIDLLSQSEIRVREGQELDSQAIQDVQAPIYRVAGKMQEAKMDYERIKANLATELGQRVNEIIEAGGLHGINLDNITSPEEKLFLVLADSIYGSKAIDLKKIKELMITYEFANFDDITDYIAGTNDRVSRAGNKNYALLCEVGAFYSDRIKEVNRRLTQAAWENPAVAGLMEGYFRDLASGRVVKERREQINRLQIGKLGLSESFLAQAKKALERRFGREYTPEQVQRMIRRYEVAAGGLKDKASASENPQTRAFYGQLRSQRERTIAAAREIGGGEFDLENVHLGEMNLEEMIAAEVGIIEGNYDEEQFASYTVQELINLFSEEREKVDAELAKFESLAGKQREVLYANFTKFQVSAHARMVGGVCVSGDNPDKYPGENMWDMPNYFQLVLQEPDTLQCQGLVLMHSITQGDKKILTASINPSSTYLYSVDEAALFGGIMDTLEEFASANGFDSIVLSQNRTIRTNRTGGEFEKAMDGKVAQIGKALKFDEPQQFSYHPNYKLRDVDVVWEKPAPFEA